MERLDFASVMAVLRRNIPDENFGNQADFLDSLFLDMGFSPQTAMEFDQGQVCRWINGLARLSPNIISFYQEKDNVGTQPCQTIHPAADLPLVEVHSSLRTEA